MRHLQQLVLEPHLQERLGCGRAICAFLSRTAALSPVSDTYCAGGNSSIC